MLLVSVFVINAVLYRFIKINQIHTPRIRCLLANYTEINDLHLVFKDLFLSVTKIPFATNNNEMELNCSKHRW